VNVQPHYRLTTLPSADRRTRIMDNASIASGFRDLSTALLADACLRNDIPVRMAPAGIRPLLPRTRLAGRVLPARHSGSVDVFLEAMGSAQPGDVLVIDNAGRTDEACIGDLVVLEAGACGLAGLVVWGLHRDTADLESIGIPVFSYGACSSGPRRLDPQSPVALLSARFGDFLVGREDMVFADADGVVFAPAPGGAELLELAASISRRERDQATLVGQGRTLRQQLRFEEYLGRRAGDASYTFRRHLRHLGGAIEE